jgi:hypothetical protein
MVIHPTSWTIAHVDTTNVATANLARQFSSRRTKYRVSVQDKAWWVRITTRDKMSDQRSTLKVIGSTHAIHRFVPDR